MHRFWRNSDFVVAVPVAVLRSHTITHRHISLKVVALGNALNGGTFGDFKFERDAIERCVATHVKHRLVVGIEKGFGRICLIEKHLIYVIRVKNHLLDVALRIQRLILAGRGKKQAHQTH